MRRSQLASAFQRVARSSPESCSASAQQAGFHPITARWFSTQPASNAAAAAAAAAVGGELAAAPSALRQAKRLWQNYKKLSKFRLSMLVVATSSAGYVAGSKEKIDWAGLGWTSLGTFMASASANTLNQIYEVVNDGRMKRTMARPLPSGRMTRAHAAVFAAVMGVGSVWLLLEKTNATTAALGGANILLYAGVYTPLKQISVVNTWIGAVVGAVPPLMGWAAAAGELDVGSAILAAGLYFWQMPHFMALAWMCRADYAAGGYRMLSLIDPTGKRVAACALRNCVYLFPLGLLATWLGVTTPYFAYESALITAGMTLTAAKFYGGPTTANARLLFRASLLHLPIFMGAFLLHRKPNTEEDKAHLFVRNVRLLGIGEPLHAEEREAESASFISRTMAQVSLPPLPFLPVPMELVCPSKVICEEQQEDQGGEGEHEREGAEGSDGLQRRQQQQQAMQPAAAGGAAKGAA